MQKLLLSLVTLLALASHPFHAHAGIPVFDGANVANTLANLQKWKSQLEEMAAHYKKLQAQLQKAEEQYEALTNARGIADALNSPLLQNYLPQDAADVLKTINQFGTSGNLTTAAKALRDAHKLFDCSTITLADERLRCEKEIEAAYQYQAYLQSAADPASKRLAQINELLKLAANTKDPKEIAEAQARIAGEQAMLQHEAARVELMRATAEIEHRVSEAQLNESKRARTARSGSLTAF
jgi:type IV secretion system protein VirB5